MNRAFKASLRPVRNLVMTMISNILVCGILFELFEEGNHGPLGPLYWAVTTATTTGYGDISPVTYPGRIVGMWLMVTSLALFAVATAQIATALIQDPHIFSHEEQEELKDDTDDLLALSVLIADKLGIPIPSTVEEADEILREHKKGNNA